MSSETLMTHQKLDGRFEKAKNVIARKNQDGSVILMKADESSLFYKIHGIAAWVWGELEEPKSTRELVKIFSEVFPTNETELNQDIPRFLGELLEQKVISPSERAGSGLRSGPACTAKDYSLGGIKEFNLEQIEAEVLSDGIYLDVFAGSDMRLKRNIVGIENALEKIGQLQGVTFDWDGSRIPAGWPKTGTGTQAGLIAQEVASVMPELVRLDSDSGFLTMDYGKLTSYLVEGIKELNGIVQSQQKRIEALEAKFIPPGQLHS